MHHPIDRIAHTTAYVTPVMEHWLEREIAQWGGRKEGNVYLTTHSIHLCFLLLFLLFLFKNSSV